MTKQNFTSPNRRQFLSATLATSIAVPALANRELFADQADNSQNSTEVSPHLDEVLAMLNVPVDGSTPLEKQESLLKYFRNRKVRSVYELETNRKLADIASASNSQVQKTAQLALEHKFPGQGAYGYIFRGKDEIDWDTNPVKDMEWIWQFHRFYWLPSLAIEYARTGDEKFAREWAFEMRSWIDHMHQPKNTFRHPGWRSLDTVLRMKTWGVYLEFFLKSPALDSRLLVDIIYSLNVHCKRIEDCCRAAQGRLVLGNWDIFHVDGLLFTAASLPELKTSVQKIEFASQLMVDFQKKVMLSDGVINEYIPSYHMAYPVEFSRLIRVCRELELPTSIPQDYLDLLEKSIGAVAIWSHPDGTAPVFGDAWLQGKDANRHWIKQFLPLFDRPDWKFFASNGKEGVHPESRFGELPTAGYYTMRSDWSETARFIVVKNSNTTRFGHNQADNMTFELSAFGERLMSDSGCYNYSGEPKWRAYFRSPAVHQLVSLDKNPILSRGRKVAQKTIEPQDGKPGIDLLTLENEPTNGLIHKRSFALVDGRFFVILDTLSGSASGELRQHFQLLPGEWNWNPDTFTARTRHSGHANLILAQAKEPKCDFAEEEGWISNDYMKKEQRPAFAFVQKKDANAVCYFATLLVPVESKDDPMNIPTTIVMESPEQVKVQIGNESWTVEM